MALKLSPSYEAQATFQGLWPHSSFTNFLLHYTVLVFITPLKRIGLAFMEIGLAFSSSFHGNWMGISSSLHGNWIGMLDVVFQVLGCVWPKLVFFFGKESGYRIIK